MSEERTIKQKVWLAGQFIEKTESSIAWEFQGVFSTRYAAVEACKGYNWFVFSALVGEELPAETESMREFEYPI